MRLPPPPPPGRVLGLFHAAFQASGYYRVVAPLSCLPGATWATYGDVTAAQIAAAETVVCARLGGDVPQVAAFIGDLQARGKRVILDYDDDYFADWPGFAGDVARRERLIAGVAHALTLADAVVVPNAVLRDVYAPRAAGPVHVLPNAVRPDWWTPPAPRHGPPVVGLLGSPSHVEDWRQVEAPLRRLRRAWPQAIVYAVGYVPDYLDGVVTHYSRWVSLREVMGHLNACDVILAPLADTPFNRGKSPGRALEAGLARAACIGSPTVYGPVLAAAGLPVADGRPDSWYDPLRAYLDDPARMRADGAALHAYVTEAHDVRRLAGALTTIYEEVPAWR